MFPVFAQQDTDTRQIGGAQRFDHRVARLLQAVQGARHLGVAALVRSHDA